MSQLRVDLTMLKQQKESIDGKLPFMESQIADFNSVIERLTREVEKETRRRADLAKDRDLLQAKNQQMQEVFNKLQIEDPDQFKIEFDNLKKDILKLKKQLGDKQKAV